MSGAPVSLEMRPGGIAVITLGSEPVNSMNLDFWKALRATLKQAEEDKSTRCVIFQSGLKKDIFTAGNDIKELYAPMTTKERYLEFWSVSNNFLADLYYSRLYTVSAIRGACPAGGCILSLCCDARIMTANGTFGLNEVALGISVPKYWARLFCSMTGTVKGEEFLLGARVLGAIEAFKNGLVTQVIQSSDSSVLLYFAEAHAHLMLKTGPDAGRAATKRLLRGDFTQEWRAFIPQEAQSAWTMLSLPVTVAALEAVLVRLSGGKGKAQKGKGMHQNAKL